MGIVQTQSIKNTIFTFIGFIIGAINTLVLYVYFLGQDYYGITAFVLSTANLLMPLMSFGFQNTLIKFFAHYSSEKEKSIFLNGMLLFPLIGVVFWLLILLVFHPNISAFVGTKNPILINYFWVIPIVAILMGYFEIFYAWLKVHKQSVFGNFLKEVLLRVLVSIGLILVFFEIINNHQFVWLLIFFYGLIMLMTAIYAFRVRPPRLYDGFKMAWQPVIKYSLFIAFSSGISILLLDIDKFMIGKYLDISQNAFYSVAIFISLTIQVPLRAMHQITHPITSEFMAKNQWDALQSLYQKSSITLQVISGYIMLGIFINMNQIYQILPQEYSVAMWVVFLIALSKFFDAMLGNNNSIIYNSKYYTCVLWIGLGLIFLTVTLNLLLIPLYGLIGVALATLISVLLYSFVKLLFVVIKMKLYPFTKKTIESLFIISICFVIFYFWEFNWHPVLNIIVKSSLFSLVYVFLNFYQNISEDVNNVIKKVMRNVLRLKKRKGF